MKWKRPPPEPPAQGNPHGHGCRVCGGNRWPVRAAREFHVCPRCDSTSKWPTRKKPTEVEVDDE